MSLGKVQTDNPTMRGFSFSIAGVGVFTLNGASTVTVEAPSVQEGSFILVTLNTPHGTVGAIPKPLTIVPGHRFTINGTALDTSEYNYAILNIL